MEKQIAKIFLLISIIFLLPLSSEAKWKATVLRGTHAWGASLALDQAGQPHIVYRDAVSHVFKHIYMNGVRWRNEVIDEEDSGWSNAIAIDSAGHIHVSYYAEMEGTSGWEGVLRYAYFDGTSWTTTTVDSSGGSATSITVDADNMPHISYEANDKLMYAHYDGNDWVIEDTGLDACWFGETSIALTSSGRVYIGFLREGALPGPVYVANNVSGSWEAVYVGEGNNVSLALDGQGYPHIVYCLDNYNYTGGVMYSRYDGSVWTTETILAASNSGYAETPDIAIDLSGNIHITFLLLAYELSKGKFLHAYFDSVKWNIETVKKVTGSYGTLLALDSMGLPHVSSLKYNNRSKSFTIMYAYYKAPQKPGK